MLMNILRIIIGSKVNNFKTIETQRKVRYSYKQECSFSPHFSQEPLLE